MSHSVIHFSPLDWSLLALYGGLLLFISLREGKGAPQGIENYILAGRKLTLPSFIATTVSTWYGGILGVGEYSYSYGVSNWLVFGVPYYLGAMLFGLYLAPRASKARLMTIPDQIETFYGPRVATGAAIYVYLMTVPAAYVLMIGVMIQLLLGTSLLVGVSIGALITTGYVLVGGFRSDLRSDWLNFLLMFSTIALVLVVVAAKYGGIGYLRANVPAAHFQWNGGNTAGYVLSWYLIAMSALIEPSFYQRVYAAESPNTARRGILLSIPFWILFDFMTTSLGLYSRAILGPNINGTDAYPLIADLALPVGVKALFFIGMLATIQSTVDSYALIAASTLSHDILWKIRRIRGRFEEVSLTRITLLIGTVVSVVMALYMKSVIDIWNKVGSLGTPGLMFPLALSYSEKWRYRKFWAGLNLAICPAVVGWWYYARTDSAAVSSFPYSIEPIYIGFGMAILIWLLDRITRPH